MGAVPGCQAMMVGMVCRELESNNDLLIITCTRGSKQYQWSVTLDHGPTAATAPGKYFLFSLVFGEAFAERPLSLWSTWQKKKWYKVLGFKPDLYWSFFWGRQYFAFPGQRKRQWVMWGLMTKGATLCVGAQRRCHFSSESTVWLLRLLAQFWGALSQTTPSVCPGHLDAVSLPRRYLVMHTFLAHGRTQRGSNHQSKHPSFLIYWRPLPVRPEAEPGLFYRGKE